MGPLEIRVDDLRGPEVVALLVDHGRAMAAASPPESCHVLNLDDLRQPDLTLWSVWEGAALAGCGAMKELTPHHGEIKSMRTVAAYQRRGVASQLLRHIIAEAQRRGYHRLSLETGSMALFAPARRLYARFGFVTCPPFGDYVADRHSVFMTLPLHRDRPPLA
jgi:putative acetyltransferase